MTQRFTATINVSPSDGQTQNSERAQIIYCLEQIEQAVGGQTATSGNVIDRTGAVAGSWSYTSTATK
jgi:hypothetical protein